MSKCAVEGCAREAREGLVCCGACVIGSHTINCNIAEYPEFSSAEYYHNPNRELDILQRLAKAEVACEILQKEFKEIRNISMSLQLNWGPDLESLLAHLEIDLQWTAAAIKRLTGG